jgi:hypothetical protein
MSRENTMPLALESLIEFEASQENPIQGLFELHWFPEDVLERFIVSREMRKRFSVFGKTADGYPYLLWLDDTDVQKVVCFNTGDYAVYLADSFIDFMILLSMGHFEEGDKNPNFKPWIEKTLGITIPDSDIDLMKNKEANNLDFQKWMHKHCEGF